MVSFFDQSIISAGQANSIQHNPDTLPPAAQFAKQYFAKPISQRPDMSTLTLEFLALGLRYPLHEAAANGLQNVVIRLIGMDRDVNETDNINATPLHYATLGGHTEVVQLLVKATGCNLNAQDSLGHTPLSHAAANGFTKIVRVLLAAHANANLQDLGGNTPLHHAVHFRQKEAIIVLLEHHQINVNPVNGNGDINDPANTTPLDEASEILDSEFHVQTQADSNIKRILKAHGALTRKDLAAGFLAEPPSATTCNNTLMGYQLLTQDEHA